MLAGFRYGREDLDVLGLNFRRDLIDVRKLGIHSIFHPVSASGHFRSSHCVWEGAMVLLNKDSKMGVASSSYETLGETWCTLPLRNLGHSLS